MLEHRTAMRATLLSDCLGTQLQELTWIVCVGLAVVAFGCSDKSSRSHQTVDLSNYFKVPAHLTNSFQASVGFELAFDLIVPIPTAEGPLVLTDVELPRESGFELKSSYPMALIVCHGVAGVSTCDP